MAVSPLAWLHHIPLDGELAKAEPKTLRFRILSAPVRHDTHIRSRVLKIPTGWTWAEDLAAAWTRIDALYPA